MLQKEFKPNLKTPKQDFSKNELIKESSNGLLGNLAEEMRDDKANLSDEAKVLAKFYGIHLQFNRAKTGQEKDWVYMLRLTNPGGGPITCDQWALLDDLADQYARDSGGNASIRLSTRQAIQFHWLSKKGTFEIIKKMAENGLKSLNGSGDNIRNVSACPLSRDSDIFDANKLSHKLSDYFELPNKAFIKIFAIDPDYIRKPEKSFDYGKRLWAKTKIGISAVHKDSKTGKIIPDNCVEIRINEIGIAPIIEGDKVKEVQIYLGGGQGERNTAKTMACLGLPFCRISKENLIPTLDAIAHIHKEWGDRQNRHWARLKYLVKAKGIEWYRSKAEERLGYKLNDPLEDYDYGARHLHHGWQDLPNGKLAYGIFIENGRITNASPNGKIKSMIRELMDSFHIELIATANQDILFKNIPQESKNQFEEILKKHGYGQRNGKPYSKLRLLSGSCVGLYTCPMSYTESEQFEPFLIEELEKLGWGNLVESIGITGCERQCFRPATKSVGLVGSGRNFYQLKLLGTDDARHQGKPIIDRAENKIYLRMIPRDKVSVVLDALFNHYKQNRLNEQEGLGQFNRRIGLDKLIAFFKENPETAPLMNMAFPADFFMEME